MLDDFIKNLTIHAGTSRLHEKDTHLFFQDDPVQIMYIVAKGMVELIRHQVDGNTTILQRARDGSVLAEASLYSDQYHCGAVVRQPSEIFILPKAAFLKLLRGNESLSTAWAARLAREVQSTRGLLEILSRKTVSQRLDGWIAWQGGELPPRGQWRDVALQIGVSPEALYRELASRRSV